MSTTIDQKVVEMRFDNRQFESNVKSTMSTLERLKQSLNFTGATKGLENIDDASKKINFSGLSNAVETVQARFSAMQVVAVTALANIANQAVNTGKRLISAFTIDPIRTGFQEYETQINAVQTILANTSHAGTSLEDVNAALDELNKYADMTIYNFTEMTRNIGTFTAAGVSLEDSTAAIKGIANLAAVSGSTSQQASNAMYQLSQALAAGKVSLMDWNSVVNAGMGGKVFQDALMNTAEAMGIVVDRSISFRDSISAANGQDSWLTSEVLLNTLKQFTGDMSDAELAAMGFTKAQIESIQAMAVTATDAATKVKTFTQLFDTLKEAAQSGWTQTWEILVGGFEEAKELLTELSNTFGEIINKSAESRNALLYDGLSSNWKKLTDEIQDAGLSTEDFKKKVEEVAKAQKVDIDAIVKDYGSLEKAFKNGALSSDLLNDALLKMTGTSADISKQMDELRGKYKSNSDIINALTKAGYEYQEIQNLTEKANKNETIALTDLTDAQLMHIGYTEDQVLKIRNLEKYSDLASGSVKNLIDNIAVPGGRELLIDALRLSLRSLIDIFGAVGKAWREVFPPTTADQLYSMTKSIRDFIESIRPSEETLGKITRTFKGLFSILSIGKQAVFAIVRPFLDFLGVLDGVGSAFLDTTASMGDWLVALDQSIKAGGGFTFISETLSKLLGGIRIGIDSIIEGVGGLSGIFTKVKDAAINAFDYIFDKIRVVANWIRDNITAGDIFAGLAGGGIFVAVKKLGGLFDKIKDFFDFGDKLDLGGFKEVIDGIGGALESFQQGLNSASILAIATAVTMLTSSVRKLSELEPGEIAISLGTIRLMITSLNSGFRSMVKSLSIFGGKGTVRAGIAMIAIAKAVNMMAEAMKKISDLNLREIGRGLAGMGGAILELSLAIRIISKGGVTLRTSVAILALAKATEMLGDALSKFSKLSWDEIGRGLSAMGGALLEFTISLSILSKAGGFGSLLGGTGLLVAVQSLDEISENLECLGKLSWGQIERGLTAMGGALGELTVALGVLSKVGGLGSILGGAGLLIAVQSLDEISENLKRLGSLTWDQIERGLGAMGGALAELGVVIGSLGKFTGFKGILGAGSLVIGVQSLEKLAEALKSFGKMSWDEIKRGLSGMGGALAELGIIVGALGKVTGLSGLLGSGSILLGVQGLSDLADALKKFGGMTWDEIGRGLAGMGGALLEVGIITGALGKLAPLAGLVGSGSLLLAIQGLGDLADAFKKFAEMSWDEIGRGLSAMGAAMGETALGGLLNTFSGIGANSIATIAVPLGDLADSVKKWEGINVPENLGTQIGSLANGIMAFNFAGWGADAIAAVATPLGDLAGSISKWTGVIVPETLGTQIGSLAEGIKQFNFSGWGADAIAAVATPLGDLAGSIKKWTSVTIPDGLEEELTSIANGVKAFSFAFVGGWSMDSILGPLGTLADTVKKWKDVYIPYGIDEDLSALADGVKAFSFAFIGGWSIDSIKGPLSDLADAVKKWNGVTIDGIGPQLEELSAGLSTLKNTNIDGKFNKNLRGFFEEFADSNVSTAVANINTIVLALSRMSGIDTNAISNFGTALTNLGEVSVSGLVSALQNGADQVSSAISTLIASINTALMGANVLVSMSASSAGSSIANGVISGVQTGLATLPALLTSNLVASAAILSTQSAIFKSSGTSLGNQLIEGIKSSITTLPGIISSFMDSTIAMITGTTNTFQTVGNDMVNKMSAGFMLGSVIFVSQVAETITQALSQVDSRASEFSTAGQTLMGQLVAGIRVKSLTMVTMMITVMTSVVNAIRSQYSNFYNAGGYLARGFAAGMESHMDYVRRMARRLAREAYEAAMDELDAHSPSRLFTEVGSYVPLGFAIGLTKHGRDVKDSARSMADNAIDSVKTAISKVAEVVNSDMDTQPTIRPVLDLSDVDSKARTLNAMFSQQKAMSISASMDPRNNKRIDQNGENPTPAGNTTYQFTQNNYSPKALSRVEIYRQTKNQISAARRAVKV